MLPPSSDFVTKDPKWPQAFQVFSEQMKYARPRGPSPAWPQISKAIYSAMQAVMTHQSDAVSALKTASETVTKLSPESAAK